MNTNAQRRKTGDVPAMRVLVLWASETSPNLGVRALARGSRDYILRVWPEAEFTFADFGQRPRELPWGSMTSLIRERLSGRLGMMRWLRGFDLIWDTRSGDSFADIYGMGRLSVMSSVHEFARQAGVLIAMAPQTIGPFTTRRGRFLARRTLRRSGLVLARDPRSAEAAAALGRPVDSTVTDLVFGIDQPEAAESRDVLLNVSGLLWNENSHVDAFSYRSAIYAIIDALIAQGRRVTLLPHVLESASKDNDVPTARALAKLYGDKVDLFIPEGLDDARSVIASANVLVGARMHACLNALSTGVPAIAMAYSRKFDPLLRAIEWPYVVSLASSTDAAAEVLAALATSELTEQAVRTLALANELLGNALPVLRNIR
jgi:colanic acid/amylovoran biosynthesis protein